MGNPHLNFININDCVTAYMDESEQGIHKQFKLTQLAFRACDELGLDFFYRIKSVKLPVKGNFTVELPADFINYTKVGVLNGKGEVMPLTYNNKLTTYADLLPKRVEKTQDESLFNWAAPFTGVFYNFWNGTTFGNLYGVPSGAPFIGSFKIDIHNGVLLLNDTFGYEYIILEYLASPDPNESYYVPIQFKEAVIALENYLNTTGGEFDYNELVSLSLYLQHYETSFLTKEGMILCNDIYNWYESVKRITK